MWDILRLCGLQRERENFIFIVSLNNLNIFCFDIVNDYLKHTCQEKIWFEAGPRFGSKECCRIIVVHKMYALKTIRADLRSHLAQYIYTK